MSTSVRKKLMNSVYINANTGQQGKTSLAMAIDMIAMRHGVDYKLVVYDGSPKMKLCYKDVPGKVDDYTGVELEQIIDSNDKYQLLDTMGPGMELNYEERATIFDFGPNQFPGLKTYLSLSKMATHLEEIGKKVDVALITKNDTHGVTFICSQLRDSRKHQDLLSLDRLFLVLNRCEGDFTPEQMKEINAAVDETGAIVVNFPVLESEIFNVMRKAPKLKPFEFYSQFNMAQWEANSTKSRARTYLAEFQTWVKRLDMEFTEKGLILPPPAKPALKIAG